MKKLIYLTAALCLCLTLASTASHLKGGEITWECQGNGQYIFQLKLYRDCNGIVLGTIQKLVSTGGGLDTILLNLIDTNDLTPAGCGNICNNPNGFNGATEEFIFRSDPITLMGVPPASGWIFYWNYECCRNQVDNVVSPTQMVLRSVMYPVVGSVADTCFDSSPFFAEKPTSFICIGYPYTYSPIGYDLDLDSIVYSFDYPYDNGTTGGLGGPMTFILPYSVTNPVPGNPVMDSLTGAVSMYPLPGTISGNFAMVLKATTFRCGQINAEIFREMQVSFSASGCTGVLTASGSTINTPPEMSPAPFADSTGAYTLYTDTVDAGDTVQFSLNYTEPEINIIDTTFQDFWINAFGAQLDSGSVAPYVNCATPPCAYLSETTPAGPFTISHAINFNWVTDCAHASFVNDCLQELNTYFFVFNAKDDGCPAPATNYKTVSISVRKLLIYHNFDTLFTNSNYTNLQWYLNGVAIPGATGNFYVTTNNGIYTLQATTPGGCTLSSNPFNRMTVGVNDPANAVHSIQIIPNPSNSITTINASSFEDAVLTIYDVTGRIILQKPFKKQATLDAMLKAGLYIVEWREKAEGGRRVLEKMIRD